MLLLFASTLPLAQNRRASAHHIPWACVLQDLEANAHARGHIRPLDESNPLVIKVLTGSATSYASHPQQPIGTYPHSAARDTLLISAIQVCCCPL